MNFVPRAVNDTFPRRVFPLAAFSSAVAAGRNSRGCLGRAFELATGSVPVQETPVGLIGAPPAVTRTVAETCDPAFGFAGDSLTALASPSPAVEGVAEAEAEVG